MSSEIGIIFCSSITQLFMCFRSFTLLIYHLDVGERHWVPTSPPIQASMKRMRSLIGTSTTGNISRHCFLNKKGFLKWATSTIDEGETEWIEIIHQYLSVILRVYNSIHKSVTNKLYEITKTTYELIVTKLLDNYGTICTRIVGTSVGVIDIYNNGFVLKIFSEESFEAFNTYVQKFREHLSRKISFELLCVCVCVCCFQWFYWGNWVWWIRILYCQQDINICCCLRLKSKQISELCNKRGFNGSTRVSGFTESKYIQTNMTWQIFFVL